MQNLKNAKGQKNPKQTHIAENRLAINQRERGLESGQMVEQGQPKW